MNNILLEIQNDRYIKVTTERKLSEIVLRELIEDSNSKHEFINNKYIYIFPMLSYNSFVFKCISDKFKNIDYKDDKTKQCKLPTA